jgi:hypothetical protein
MGCTRLRTRPSEGSAPLPMPSERSLADFTSRVVQLKTPTKHGARYHTTIHMSKLLLHAR